jgi:hypothetical protein
MPKTILYNSEDNTIIGTFPDGYRVDGKPQEVDPPIYELPYTNTTPPEINQETHYLTSKYEVDMERKEYKQVWNICKKVVVAPQTSLSEVIGILIKKVIDGVALTEEETLTLKSYNDGTENYS